MFKLDTDMTLAELRQLQRRLERVEASQTSLVRATAQFGVNEVRERIQFRGENAEGERMLSSSAKKIGRYSESHGKVRQQEGLRTDLINLTFSGELLNGDSWTVIDESDGFGAGFSEQGMSDRAGHLEELFGPIFQLSPSEEEATADYFNNSVSDLVDATL
jgi:hypothetical protein